MNYRHIYHAGGFSDVFKHTILIALIQSLLKKETPFCYIDTHAGIGNYDLHLESAQKTQEFQYGISKLQGITDHDIPDSIATYLNIIQTWNHRMRQDSRLYSSDLKELDILRYYPGSPVFARELLRDKDHIILAELHPEDAQTLKQLFKQDKQVATHFLDGYTAFKAFLPPKEKRGLVLIDPPFEKTDEFETLIQKLTLGIHRWRNGIYAIWYPLKNPRQVNHFYKNLSQIGASEILCYELYMLQQQRSNHGMHACGMAILQPPWGFKETLERVLPWLCQKLGEGVKWREFLHMSRK